MGIERFDEELNNVRRRRRSFPGFELDRNAPERRPVLFFKTGTAFRFIFLKKKNLPKFAQLILAKITKFVATPIHCITARTVPLQPTLERVTALTVVRRPG